MPEPVISRSICITRFVDSRVVRYLKRKGNILKLTLCLLFNIIAIFLVLRQLQYEISRLQVFKKVTTAEYYNNNKISLFSNQTYLALTIGASNITSPAGLIGADTPILSYLITIRQALKAGTAVGLFIPANFFFAVVLLGGSAALVPEVVVVEVIVLMGVGELLAVVVSACVDIVLNT